LIFVANMQNRSSLAQIQRMLSLFRSNQIVVSGLLLIYVCLVRAGIFWQLPAFETIGEPAFFTEMVHLLVGRNAWLAALIASILVLLQGILVNRIANNFQISNQSSFFPGLFFVLMASSIPDFLKLSAPLLATTFVLLAFNQLLGTWNSTKVSGHIYNVGFWIGVSTLFYLPTLWLVFASVVGLNLIRGFDFRERMMIFCGFLTPIMLAWTWFFWQDAGGWFWEKHFLSRQIGFIDFFAVPQSETLLAKILFLSLIGIGLVFNSGVYYHKKLIQGQKYVSVCFWFLMISAAVFLLRPAFDLTHFYLCTPFLGIFLGITFLNIKNQQIAEVLHLFLLFAVAFLAIWAS
jgi:hypothetical protein